MIDYEVRRELLRAGKLRGLRRLDVLKGTLYYQPLTTETMLTAAECWAEVRQQGRPTAATDALEPVRDFLYELLYWRDAVRSPYPQALS